jgi:hypothetical protein
VPGRGFDQVPAHAVADGADAVLRQLAVVLRGQTVVPGAGDQVQAAAVGAAVRGALEPAQEKAAEQRRSEGHAFTPFAARLSIGGARPLLGILLGLL